MGVRRETLLCRYQYDPLDRVANCAPLNQESVQRYYRKNRLATEIQGQVQYSVFEHKAQLLAQQQREAGRVASALLATDLQRSVLHSLAIGQHQRPVYSPYGHRSPESGLLSLLGFNGERRDPVTGHYLLGNGYRAFNPVLMRFNSPDSLSPFGKGGVNAYAYCLGDPVNQIDPMGTFAVFARGINKLISVSISSGQQARKGLSAIKNGIVNNFAKAPKQAQNGKGLDYNTDMRRLRTIGYEYKQLSKTAEPPPIARFAKSRGYSEEQMFAQEGYQNFPEVQAQYRHAKNPQTIEWVSQKDVKLRDLTEDLVKKYPDKESDIRGLVSIIRSR